MSTVHLLISPDAGRGRAAGAHHAVLETIRSAGHTPVDLTCATADDSAAAAAAAVAAGASRLIVVGGDGLVHLAVQAVAGSTTTLGVVPVGTGNDFARGLTSIPDDPVEATHLALRDPKPLDLIHSDAGWVASIATAGFSGDVNARANRLRFPKGPSRYTVATVLELPTLHARPVRLTVDGEPHEFNAALLAIANTGWFGGGMHIAPDAAPDDGLLDLTVVADVGRVELMRFFRLVFSGRHLTHPKVHALRGRRVVVESLDPDTSELELWGDGDPIGTTPSSFEVAPGALKIAR